MDVERANWRTLDSRMMSAINAPGTPGKIQAWAAYDYADADIFGNGVSTNGQVNTVAVGGDVRVTDRLLAGVQFALHRIQGRLQQQRRRLQAARADAHVLRRLRRRSVVHRRDAGHRLARLQYQPQHRSSARRRAPKRARPGGYHNVARLLGGYWFRYQDWNHGPFAKLTYEKIVVRQFSENGNDSTALTYGQQTVDATWSSLGWQVAGNLSGWRPFARATWEYNFQNDTRQVSATPVGLNGTYVVPGFQQDDNWWLFDLGVSRDFGKVTGFISGNASAGKGDGDYWAVTVGIRVPL